MTTNRDARSTRLDLDERGRLNYLSFRERTILALRLGLFSDRLPMSTEEVGATFKVSRARVRQIELGALEKLKQYLERT